MIILPDNILNFAGYGNIKSDLWFISPEEGGSLSEATLHQRSLFSQVEDIYPAHSKIQEAYLFRESVAPPLQHTLGKFCKIIAKANNEDFAHGSLVKIQTTRLGRLSSNNFLGYLFPVPKKGVSYWPNTRVYQTISPSANGYYRDLCEYRCKLFSNLISTNKPAVVIFHGKRFWPMYEKCIPNVANLYRNQVSKHLYTISYNKQTFIFVRHLAYSSNKEIDAIASIILENDLNKQTVAMSV